MPGTQLEQPWPLQIVLRFDDKLSEAAMMAVEVDEAEPVWFTSQYGVAAYLRGRLRPELDEPAMGMA